MGAGGMGAGGGGSVAYQETIVVNIDERRWGQQIQQTERSFQQMIQRMQKMQDMQIKLKMNDQASGKMRDIQKQVSDLNKTSMTTLRVGVTDEATGKLAEIQKKVDQLGKGTNVQVRSSGGAGGGAAGGARKAAQEGESLLSRAGGVASGAAGAAGGIAETVAPELAGGGALAALGGGALAVTGVGAAVVGVGVAVGVATRDAADFNHELMIVKNNTTMTAGEMETLRKAVSDESQEFGLSTSSLIDASRQIQDLTQNSDAMQGILRVAGEAAAATGADVSQVGNILASTLHQYKQDQGDAATVTEAAAKAMGVLHVASAEGNMTMQQFADNSGRAVALASQMNVPLDQVAAAMAALTRNGYDAAQSQTQVVNMMTHIVKPAKQAEDEIQRLSTATGVDLVSAYSATGLSTLGFTGIFDKTVQAYKDLGMTAPQATEETLKLLNAQRGGIGAALLMGKGATDYDQILKDLNDDQLTGQYVTKAWGDAQKDPEVRMAQLGQRMGAFSRTIGEALVPALNGAIDLAINMGDNFDKLGTAITQNADVQGRFQAVSDAVTGALSAAWGLVPSDVQDDLQKVGSALEQRGGEWASTAATKASEMIGSLSSATRDMAGQAAKALQDVVDQMWAGFSAWWSTAGPTIGNAIWGAVRGGLNFLKQQLGISSPSTVMRNDIAGSMMDGLIGGIQGKMPDLQGVLGNIATAIQSKLGQAGDWVTSHLPGGGGGGGVSGWISQAVQNVGGLSQSWIGGLTDIVMHESSGNPNAANLTDVNAQHGDPSRGLMQLTGTNRARYTPAGMDPMDPVAQIMAGIAYIKDRYGDIANVPGVRSLAAGGAYKPYDQGGFLQPGLTMAVNNTGAPERVIPPRMAVARGRSGTAQLPSRGGGPLVSIGQIVQQPGEDGQAFAQRVSSLVAGHIDRWAGHIEEAFGSMPDGAIA